MKAPSPLTPVRFLPVVAMFIAACSPSRDDHRSSGPSASDEQGVKASICSPDAWCWVAPAQTGNAITGTTLLPDGQRVFVGRGGTRLELDVDGSLTGSTLQGWNTVADVWLSTDTDVAWAPAAGGVIHEIEGSAWRAVQTPTTQDLTAVHGAGHHVWAVGVAGDVVHFDGVEWSVETPFSPHENAYSGVWASSPSDVWIAGRTNMSPSHAVVGHFDGVSWSYVPIAPNDEAWPSLFNAVWGDGRRVWFTSAAGGGEAVWRWEPGEGYVRPVREADAWSADSVHGTGPNDVWIAGSTDVMHFDGAAWEVVHRTWGEAKVPRPDLRTDAMGGLVRVRATAPDDVWIVSGSGRASHWDGETFQPLGEEPPVSGAEKVVARSADDIWLLSQYGASRFDGDRWDARPPISYPTRSGYIEGYFVDAVAAGDDLLRLDRVDGETYRLYEEVDGDWRPLADLPLRAQTADVWASSREDVFVAPRAATNVVHHFDGDAWSQLVLPDCTDWRCRPRAVHGSGPNNVWVLAGAAGHPMLYRFDGEAWTKRVLPREMDATIVWTAAPGHGFLGTNGAILEIREDEDRVHPLGTHRGLLEFVGRRADELYVVGGSRFELVLMREGRTIVEAPHGFVARFDGTTWNTEASGVGEPFSSGWTDPSGRDTWLVTRGGLVHKTRRDEAAPDVEEERLVE